MEQLEEENEVIAPRLTKTGYPKYWYRNRAIVLWQIWLEYYGGDIEKAEAHAIWHLKLQIAGKKRSSQLKYTSLRDHFIKRHTTVGRQIGVIKEKCWHCDGNKVEPGHVRMKCQKCGGSGEYKTSPIYIHHFVVNGDSMSIISTVEPTKHGDVQEEEYYEVEKPPCFPFGGILRVISYAAVAKWGLEFVSGRYVPWRRKRGKINKRMMGNTKYKE